jgi:hypothetical protein
MGIRKLPSLDYLAKNYQGRCNLAISYLSIQIGHFGDRRNFLGFGLTPPKRTEQTWFVKARFAPVADILLG